MQHNGRTIGKFAQTIVRGGSSELRSGTSGTKTQDIVGVSFSSFRGAFKMAANEQGFMQVGN